MTRDVTNQLAKCGELSLSCYQQQIRLSGKELAMHVNGLGDQGKEIGCTHIDNQAEVFYITCS